MTSMLSLKNIKRALKFAALVVTVALIIIERLEKI